jgi:hypothetical protein
MVLENSSDETGGDPFNENPPASDDDPYSSSTPQAGPSNYRIDISKLPKPIPIIGPLTGWNDQFFLKVLQGRIQVHTQLLKRPPNQEEVEAISYWSAKQISIFSYATSVGVLAGTWRAYNTTATFRFPFWQPNPEKFNPQTFPSARLSVIKGNNAVMAWHLLRYATYGGVGKVVSQILFGSYSMTVAAVGELGDPRLKATQEAARQQGQRQRGGLPGPKMPGTAGSPQSGGMGRGKAPPVDDASPTGGMFPEENGAMSSTGFGSNTESTNDYPQTQEQPNRWPQQSRSAPPMQRAEPQDQPFDPFDDAYPTGGQGTRTDTSVPLPQRQQGSAWDRVRQGAGRGSAGRQTESGQPQEEQRGWAGVREQSQSPTASDDSAFSRETEERSLARDQAQKEFDARVERERRGGDFNSGSGDQRRW